MRPLHDVAPSAGLQMQKAGKGQRLSIRDKLRPGVSFPTHLHMDDLVDTCETKMLGVSSREPTSLPACQPILFTLDKPGRG